MTGAWASQLLPIAGTVLGFVAGLLSPLVTTALTRRTTRRADQQARCDQIIDMFRKVSVVEVLQDDYSGARRELLLTAVRLRDERAREACLDLVRYASGLDASDEHILQRWSTMIEHVARARREAS